ncbi:RES domain-containing protein [Vibrio cholerae]
MSDTKLPPIFTIPAGTQLYRALNKEFLSNGQRAYTALDPNPFKDLEWLSDTRALYKDGSAVAGRFSPFRDEYNNPVPALYLAPLKETAYYEFVLRPMSASSIKTLSKREFERLEVATITLDHDLRLADCRENYLFNGADRFWDIEFDALFNTSQIKSIDNARSLAKKIHDQYPNIDGLVWDSVRHTNVPVYVVFGSARTGKILRAIDALSDIPTWRPYLRKEINNGTLVIAPDLASII